MPILHEPIFSQKNGISPQKFGVPHFSIPTQSVTHKPLNHPAFARFLSNRASSRVTVALQLCSRILVESQRIHAKMFDVFFLSGPILSAKLFEYGTPKQTTHFANWYWHFGAAGFTRDDESLISLVPVPASHASAESI